MRRLRRWTLNTLTVLSLLSCVATCALWVRSYSVLEALTSPQSFHGQYGQIGWGRGTILVGMTIDSPGYIARRPPWDIADKVRADSSFKRHEIGGIIFERSRRNRGVLVPCWMIAVAATVAPAVCAGRWLKRRRHAALGLCPSCLYDLTGNVSGVCPECGTEIQNSVA